MVQATRTSSNRIAVVFDFDETLTPKDSFEALLEACKLDTEVVKNRHIPNLLSQGWEKYLARAYYLIKESNQRAGEASSGENSKITKDDLINVGKNIELYDGVDKLFERLQGKIKAINSEVELEFYLISGGFVDIPRNTRLAKDFKHMWGCEFHYDETGAIEFIKKQMTHSEKTRYLYYLSQGIKEAENEKDLIYNYHDTPAKELHVPLDQVIYVGDGASDVPCFAVMKEYGGLSIGIFSGDRNADNWEYLESISRSQRLSNLVPASYAEDSELVRSLKLGVEYIAKRISLSQLSIGE